MTAFALDDRGDALVVSYDAGTIIDAFSATETFIERERAYSRGGWALAEAILHRGPAPHFWESVRALQRMTDEWALFRIIAGDVAVAAAERPTFNWSYHHVWPGTLFVSYSSLIEAGSPFGETEEAASDLTQAIQPSILTMMYAEDIYRASSDGLSNMFDYFLTLQSERKIEEINQLLVSVDLTRLAPEFMVGLLRINFPSRLLLRDWDEYLRRVTTELRSRNIAEIPLILHGLETTR